MDTRQDKIRQAWKDWQRSNPEQAAEVRSCFADTTIMYGWKAGKHYLAGAIWDRINGFHYSEILQTLSENH